MRQTLTYTNHYFTAVLLEVLNLLLDPIHFRQKRGLLLINDGFPLRGIGKLFQ